MAIDGVKIIDSDDAYDIYNAIVERYKDGENVDNIIADILDEESNYCTDNFYAEIYWTALAYSLWKIGHLPEDIKTKALELIENGADDFWLEIDSKAKSQRQRALDKLAIQLQSENPRPIKVPKSRVKREPYFTQGDVISVEFEDEYGLLFVSEINQTPRKIEYHLACTRLLQKNKPSVDDFLNSEIACSHLSKNVGVNLDDNFSLDDIFDIKISHNSDGKEFAVDTDCWFNHKDLGLILDKLEKIAEIELNPYSLWTLAPAKTLNDIYEEITRDKEAFHLKFMETYKLVKDIIWEKSE